MNISFHESIIPNIFQEEKRPLLKLFVLVILINSFFLYWSVGLRLIDYEDHSDLSFPRALAENPAGPWLTSMEGHPNYTKKESEYRSLLVNDSFEPK